MSKILQSLFLVLAGMMLSLTSFADNNERLVINHIDGQTVYLLNEQPRITFLGTDLIVSTPEITDTYDLQGIDYIVYEGVTTGINDVIFGEPGNVSTECPFVVSGPSLVFTATSQSLSISVYTIDGRLIANKELREGASKTLSLEGFGPGIYVVKVNDVTYKIALR